MIIERKNFILLIISRNDVGCVTIAAFVELFEKAKAFGNSLVFSCVEIQVQPLRQLKKPFAPFALGDGAVNRPEDDDDGPGRDENKLHRKI